MKRLNWLVLAAIFISTAGAETVIEQPNVSGKNLPVNLIIYEQNEPTNTVFISHGSGCVLPWEKIWAERVQSWGYNAVIIDHCSARGLKAHTAGDLPANLQNSDRIHDYIDVVEWLDSQKFHNGKVGLVGFSRGGEAVLAFLNEATYAGRAGLTPGYSKVIDAAVVYYPGCHDGALGFRQSNVPALIHHPLSDSLVSPTWCVHFTMHQNDEAVKNTQIEEYPGAYHGFDINAPDFWVNTPRGQKLVRSYNEEQANRSVAATKSFLDTQLK